MDYFTPNAVQTASLSHMAYVVPSAESVMGIARKELQGRPINEGDVEKRAAQLAKINGLENTGILSVGRKIYFRKGDIQFALLKKKDPQEAVRQIKSNIALMDSVLLDVLEAARKHPQHPLMADGSPLALGVLEMLFVRKALLAQSAALLSALSAIKFFEPQFEDPFTISKPPSDE